MSQQLDNFSKVLLATSAIQHMYNTIFHVHNQMQQINDSNMSNYSDSMLKVVVESNSRRQEFLDEKLSQLTGIVEDLADFMNNSDMNTAIDLRIAKVPFEILLHGMDEVEGEYDTETSQLVEEPIDYFKLYGMSKEDVERRREKGNFFYDDNGRQS